MYTILLDFTALLLIFCTGLSLFRHEAWWIRAWDFPRAQLLAVGLLLILLYPALGRLQSFSGYGIFGFLCLAMLVQTWQILPYTPLVQKQSLPCSKCEPGEGFSLLLSNVFMENRQSDKLLALVRQYKPTLFFAAETDAWWADQLAPLKEDYPYFVEKPLENTYGMVIYSRLELIDPKIKYLTEPDVPSFHSDIRLGEGSFVRIHLLHPKPPYPSESESTVERDAEILIVGRKARETSVPTIVAGDLNDVAWSHTTRLFSRVSGLLDPRIGRGLYSTFHAQFPLLRWPLDHIFHSTHFKLVQLQTLPGIGSDHFPIFAELSLEPGALIQQDAPTPEDDDINEAAKKIEAAESEPPP